MVKDGTVQVGFGGELSEVNPMTLGTFKRKKKPRPETVNDRTLKEWDKEFADLP